MRFDIVSWVKNGEWCLPYTLKRLDDVIPDDFVHRKIMVDDHSVDDTKKIGELYGWEVYSNPRSGISSAANFALSKVDCPYFMSFEQDVYLSERWFRRMLHHISNSDCAVYSGVRLSYQPSYLAALDRYILDKSKICCDSVTGFRCGKNLDNTLWRTKVVKSVGGFPYTRSSTGVDTILSYILHNRGFRWVVDYDVVSVHLRKSGFNELFSHQLWYALGSKEIERTLQIRGINIKYSLGRYVASLGFSPFRALRIVAKTREPRIFLIYFLSRLASVLGYIKGT